jgi:histidine triad (HIT) family protein
VACVFCQIVQGEIPATLVYQENGVTAFRDIAPHAPVHILVVPNQHLDGAAAVTAEHEQMVGRLVHVAAEVARQEGIAESGYRLIINQGEHGGQTVNHLHVHLLGGHQLPGKLA